MKRLTILLIEDNQDVSETTCELLELSGYKVMSTSSGEEGVELARTIIPDIILCDIWMPKHSGFDVLTELKNSPETAVIPFVFLTASAEPSEVKKGLKKGADAYICKPFTEDVLLQEIERFLKKSESTKEV